MKIIIYQINEDRDTKRRLFLSYKYVEEDFDFSIYDEVYRGEVDCKDLEHIFYIFNNRQPDDYHARSFSVSDIVGIIGDDGKETKFFCDSYGFKNLSEDPLSACCICRRRKNCLDSVQPHKTTDACFERDLE